MRDVSVDEHAAREMVQRTRQMGVPVIADEQEAIVGFDMPRLQRMAARHRRGPGLGLKVADATAFSLCMDNGLPIVVFDLMGQGNIVRAVRGEKIGTLVCPADS